MTRTKLDESSTTVACAATTRSRPPPKTARFADIEQDPRRQKTYRDPRRHIATLAAQKLIATLAVLECKKTCGTICHYKTPTTRLTVKKPATTRPPPEDLPTRSTHHPLYHPAQHCIRPFALVPRSKKRERRVDSEDSAKNRRGRGDLGIRSRTYSCLRHHYPPLQEPAACAATTRPPPK